MHEQQRAGFPDEGIASFFADDQRVMRNFDARHLVHLPWPHEAAPTRGTSSRPDDRSADTSDEIVKLFLLTTSRCPVHALEYLRSSPDLQGCCGALRRAKLDLKLQSGAAVFVEPQYHRAVAEAARGLRIDTRHILVTETYLESVCAHYRKAPRRGGGQIKVKSIDMLGRVGPSGLVRSPWSKARPSWKKHSPSTEWWSSNDNFRDIDELIQVPATTPISKGGGQNIFRR
jgi:hypothetical protein